MLQTPHHLHWPSLNTLQGLCRSAPFCPRYVYRSRCINTLHTVAVTMWSLSYCSFGTGWKPWLLVHTDGCQPWQVSVLPVSKSGLVNLLASLCRCKTRKGCFKFRLKTDSVFCNLPPLSLIQKHSFVGKVIFPFVSYPLVKDFLLGKKDILFSEWISPKRRKLGFPSGFLNTEY